MRVEYYGTKNFSLRRPIRNEKVFYSVYCCNAFLLCTSFVYARSLDAETAEQELGFSVTSGIDMSKETQSTFDDSKTISGIADQGTAIEISVSTKDANGDLKESANFQLEVGASGMFSQTVELSLGENVVAITASKEGYETVNEETIVKRRNITIKNELENTVSIPGSTRTLSLTM